MSRLLSAGFSRLKRDKVFWISMLVMLIYSVICMLNGCRQATSDVMSEYQYSLDHYYFNYALSIGLFGGIFTSLFLGTEYSDGVIRNKLVIGHTRFHIYFSNLIINFSATFLMMLVWLIGGLIGIPTLGLWKMGMGLVIYLLISVLFVAAFSAIFTFIGMICSNKAISAVLCILVFLGFTIFTSMIYNALSQPELSSSILVTAEGMQMTDPTPNPNYVRGVWRDIYQFIIDFLPTGQGIQMSDLNIAHPVCMGLSSIFITIVVTLGGIVAFNKKDLK